MLDYKKIIKNKKTRIAILHLLEWIPDKQMVELQYKIHTGRKLNLNNPTRYTEKIQWYKLYYRADEMTRCVDKHAVKDYVREKAGNDINIITEVGCWDSPDDIDFKVLPSKCVLKTTNASGTNVFINDKSTIDQNYIRKQLKHWLHQANKNMGREWAYNNVPPRIICEEIIPDIGQAGKGLDDYKFFCFDGKIAMQWVDYDRFVDHKRVLFAPGGERLDIECTYKSPKEFKYPEKAFKVLKPIAEKLASGFPHARIDLYYTDEKAYFGEITFYSGSGYELFSKDKFDYELGKAFTLPKISVESTRR